MDKSCEVRRLHFLEITFTWACALQSKMWLVRYILQKLTAFQFDFTIATAKSGLYCVQTLHSEGIVFCSLNIDSQSPKACRQTCLVSWWFLTKRFTTIFQYFRCHIQKKNHLTWLTVHLVHSFGFKCRPSSLWIKRGKDDQATTLRKNFPDTVWPKATGGNMKKKN